MPWDDIVLHHHDLLKGVPHAVEGVYFLCSLFLVRHGQGRLDIIPAAPLVCHKVDLQLRTLALFLFVLVTVLHHAHIHVELTAQQLIINNVLHNVVFFLLAEIQSGISQAHIAEIILQRRTDIFSALHIIAVCLVDHKSVHEELQIPADSLIADVDLPLAAEGSGNFPRVGQGAD